MLVQWGYMMCCVVLLQSFPAKTLSSGLITFIWWNQIGAGTPHHYHHQFTTSFKTSVNRYGSLGARQLSWCLRWQPPVQMLSEQPIVIGEAALCFVFLVCHVSFEISFSSDALTLEANLCRICEFILFRKNWQKILMDFQPVSVLLGWILKQTSWFLVISMIYSLDFFLPNFISKISFHLIFLNYWIKYMITLNTFATQAFIKNFLFSQSHLKPISSYQELSTSCGSPRPPLASARLTSLDKKQCQHFHQSSQWWSIKSIVIIKTKIII